MLKTGMGEKENDSTLVVVARRQAMIAAERRPAA
jgi:hypothetical protein